MSGLLTLVILFLIGLFLFIRGPARVSIRTGSRSSRDLDLESGRRPGRGRSARQYGTVVIALIGLVIGIPISLLTALFLTEYVPTAPAGAR